MVGVNAGDIGTALGCAGYIWLYVVARYSAIANVQCENCFPASLFRSSAVMLPCSELASLCACFCLISSMSALIVSSHMRDTMRSTLPGRMGSLRAERRINASPALSLLGLVAIMWCDCGYSISCVGAGSVINAMSGFFQSLGHGMPSLIAMRPTFHRSRP